MQEAIKIALENKRRIVLINPESGSNVEIEIRFSRSVLNKSKVSSLFRQLKDETTYNVIKGPIINNVFTRCLVYDNETIIQKKILVYRKVISSFGLYMSIEAPIKWSNEIRDLMDTIQPVLYTRRSRYEMNGKVRLDITKLEDMWMMELELLDSFREEDIDELIKLATSYRVCSGGVNLPDEFVNYISPLKYDGLHLTSYPKPYDLFLYHLTPSTFKFPIIMTGKIDGVRCFLISINNVQYKYTYEHGMRLWGTYSYRSFIIDCEEIKGVILPFDVIMIDNVNISTKTYVQRLKHLSQLCKETKLRLKSFQVCISYIDMVNRLEGLRSSYKDTPIDGFLFTPAQEPYGSVTYKWKFEITLDLFVNNGKIFSGDKVCIPGQIRGLPPGASKVVECRVTPEVFVFSRPRPDKNRANSYRLIKAVTDAYKHKHVLTWPSLTGKNATLMVFSHNRIKEDLWRGMTGIVLDIGSGTGTDVSLWLRSSIYKVYAVEPDKDRFAILEKRCINTKITPINSTAEELTINELIDHVCLFFVLNRMGIEKFEVFMRRIRIDVGMMIHIIFLDPSEDVDTPFGYIKKGNSKTVTHIEGTFVEHLEEDLITLNQITSMLKTFGFRENSHKRLDKFDYLMSKPQIEFSKCFTYVSYICAHVRRFAR